MALEQLMGQLGYYFRDKKLLEVALTHPSYAGEHGTEHYQRLEFLGDAVLELAVSRHLFEHQQLSEGKLTRIRAALVREESLCEAGKALGIPPFIKLSVGESKNGGRDKPSIISDVFEAIVSAVYLDGGLGKACALVEFALGERLSRVRIEEDPLDYKTRLQEMVQANGAASPTYEMVSQRGEPHKPCFEMRVLSEGEEIGRGTGQSKRGAQQEAARNALSFLETQETAPSERP